ncbi:MAG: PadR family transcriptional regulator [Gemmatimonadaceae bacterium]|nr:PadR family transcriptional regulator [Gemmatimonadaceae bacterium]
MPSTNLGALELTILLSVARLGDDAYGLAVRRDVAARTSRDYSVGAVYTTLERLETKAFVISHMAEPLSTRGGRSRRQFKITAAGQRALRQAERVAKSVWAGVGSFLNPETA